MRRRRAALLTLLLLIGIVAIPVVLTLRQVRQEHLNQSLIAAVDRNDAPAVRRLLRQGADPDAQVLPDDRRPFWKRMWDMVRHQSSLRPLAHESLLLRATSIGNSRGANVMDNVSTAIDNVDVVKSLVEAGADINFRGTVKYDDIDWDATPLTEATLLGKWQSVQVLLAHHVDVNAIDEIGSTALMYAAISEKVDVVESLLKRGAKVNIRNLSADSALDLALDGYSNSRPTEDGIASTRNTVALRKTVALLLQYGGAVLDKHGDRTILLSNALSTGDTPLIQMLKKAEAKEGKHP